MQLISAKKTFYPFFSISRKVLLLLFRQRRKQQQTIVCKSNGYKKNSILIYFSQINGTY